MHSCSHVQETSDGVGWGTGHQRGRGCNTVTGLPIPVRSRSSGRGTRTPGQRPGRAGRWQSKARMERVGSGSASGGWLLRSLWTGLCPRNGGRAGQGSSAGQAAEPCFQYPLGHQPPARPGTASAPRSTSEGQEGRSRCHKPVRGDMHQQHRAESVALPASATHTHTPNR